MLKPTGSAGGGSVATAAAQAAIADAVHNRVAAVPKPDERRRPTASYADEISTKSRWTERPLPQDGGTRGDGRGRGAGGRGSGSTWEATKEGSRASGRGGRGFDRAERGARESFQDKDRKNFRHNSDKNVNNNSRGRESIFGTGAHVGMANTNHDSPSSGGTKTLTTTYVRQHGPPPRKVANQAVVPTAPQQTEQPPITHQPTRSAAYSASARVDAQSNTDPWASSTETSSKLSPPSPHIALEAVDDSSEASLNADSSSSQSGTYVRTHGPPRRPGREGPNEEQGESSLSQSRSDHDTSGEGSSRFGGSWGALEHRSGNDRDSVGPGERTLSGRWKEPTGSLAPPPAPTNTRWKEPREEARAAPRRWKGREESEVSNSRWGRATGDGVTVNNSTIAPTAAQSPPSKSNAWKEPSTAEWALDVDEEGAHDLGLPSTASTELANNGGSLTLEASDGATVSMNNRAEEVDMPTGVNKSSPASVEDTTHEDSPSFRGTFTHKQQQAKPVIRTASWEPQLPHGGDPWETPGHGRDSSLPQNQGAGQTGSSGSGGTSQPWSDPWGTSGFGLPASGDQGSSAMASFLNNGTDEPRKDRYLPPALRNRTPSEGNQGDSGSIPSMDQEKEVNPQSLSQGVAAADASAEDLVLPGPGTRIGAASSGGAGSEVPLYEQHQQHQQQAALEEWQQGGRQTSNRGRSQRDEVSGPIEQQLHQRPPPHQSHPVSECVTRVSRHRSRLLSPKITERP